MNDWDYLPKQSGICLVIGNGPSLNDIPISFLKKYPSFGTNLIYLLRDFIPTYYACVNPLVLEQFLTTIRTFPSPYKFIREEFAASVPDAFPLHSSPMPSFSRHPDQHIYEGYTVTYVCLQLAYWMGFEKVLLVGLDHYYQFTGQPNEENVLEGTDPNHFTGSYFQGASWNNPDLRMSEKAYQMAKAVFEADGKEIINCSTRTALDVFPTGNWRDYE